MNRQLSIERHRCKYPLESLLGCFQCVRPDEHISYGNSGTAVPPFGCTFSTAPGQQNVLAVANEEGVVRLYNTEATQSYVLKEWLAHENAVFDLAWVPGEARLVTASGDQTARLWDVKTGELLGGFKGHLCSLKSVTFPKHERAVFSTGGRDGNIMIWDTRCSKKDGFYRQVKQISGAHNKPDRNTPQTKKKRPLSKGIAPSVDSQQGVTEVLFRDDHTLLSSGAVDGMIKMWDLRKNYTAYHYKATPLQTYPYPGTSTRKLGYSGLTLDSTGSNLFSNCTDDNIYMFNVSGLKTTPVATFSGHRNSSFYVKSTVSPDDQFLTSGSSDHHAYIWKISNPEQTPMMLQGHSQEVTSVAWCPTDFTKIASCSDDNMVRIWRLDRRVEDPKASVGEMNLVGWARPKQPSRPRDSAGCHSERTPAKSPSLGSLGSLSSPQPAACAPSGADLPLPSNTSAPQPLRGAGTSPSHPRTPPSLHRWITRTPGSPGDQVTPPLSEVLSPFPESPAQSPALSQSAERRVKRRLETGSTGCCGKGHRCDCVADLYPDPKRSRSLAGVFCANRNVPRPSREESATDPAEKDEEKPGTSREADKENSVPRKANWLSDLGQRLREERRGPLSPNGNKQRDRQMPASPVCTPCPHRCQPLPPDSPTLPGQSEPATNVFCKTQSIAARFPRHTTNSSSPQSLKTSSPQSLKTSSPQTHRIPSPRSTKKISAYFQRQTPE
ncbi:denticleless protein homolog [Chanos chanos]|uniref:Denticleless protein homolog n=1 Tax=Chanos chanos TaxID=29144 RepID=A0A6J2VWZ0_CHACN|nr:denticleless protein homolog [Chanos chanos]